MLQGPQVPRGSKLIWPIMEKIYWARTARTRGQNQRNSSGIILVFKMVAEQEISQDPQSAESPDFYFEELLVFGLEGVMCGGSNANWWWCLNWLKWPWPLTNINGASWGHFQIPVKGYIKECFQLLIGEHINGTQGGRGDPVYENSSLSFISFPLLSSPHIDIPHISFTLIH